MRVSRILMVLAAAALAAGCLTVRPAPALAPAEADHAAKQFAPAADTANVYIQRTGDSLGAAVAFRVTIDGTTAAVLAPDTYELVTLTPGDHQLGVEAGSASAKLAIHVAAGKNAFYQTEPTPGRPLLQPQVSWVPIEAMGKLMINQSRRAASVQP